MAEIKEIELKIPNLGEADDTEIIELAVKPGDKVKANDPLIVLESEKAAMEVPSDFDGEIISLNVSEGDSVKEGMVFATIKTEIKNMKVSNPEPEIPEPTKVNETSQKNEIVLNFDGINAGPAVRKIARELEIDLQKINGTGKNNLITKEDLKNFVHSSKPSSEDYYPQEKLIEFGDYELVKQTKIRALGAKNLQQSWQTIPHVTHFEEADLTNIELSRKIMNESSQVKVTPLAFIIKSVSEALKEFPIFNSSLVGDGEIFMRKYINIGVAVDTDAGLIVPVIKDADKLSITDIASNIIDLSTKAKSKKLLAKDLAGATFTISSLGPMGGTGFTPIINPPEVGIIGVSRSKEEIYLDEGNVLTKKVLPLALSYDHRVINGADAGKFMLFLKNHLEQNSKK